MGTSTSLHRIFQHFPFFPVNPQLIFQTLFDGRDSFCALAFEFHRCHLVLLFCNLEVGTVIQGTIDREDAIVLEDMRECC